ncbi:MAG: hypothetical protein WBP72_02350 [Rhodocyclaceae bacterium]
MADEKHRSDGDGCHRYRPTQRCSLADPKHLFFADVFGIGEHDLVEQACSADACHRGDAARLGYGPERGVWLLQRVAPCGFPGTLEQFDEPPGGRIRRRFESQLGIHLGHACREQRPALVAGFGGNIVDRPAFLAGLEMHGGAACIAELRVFRVFALAERAFKCGHRTHHR